MAPQQYRPIDNMFISRIARNVQQAYFDLQKGLKDGTLTVEQLEAIDSMPTGTAERNDPDTGKLLKLVELTPRKRFEVFPSECCADAVAVLGIIYTMALIDPKEIVEVIATPRKWNPAINFHKWLSVGGLAVDITLGQFRQLPAFAKDAVAFTEHPIESDNNYSIEKKQFVVPTIAVKFAEHIGFAYIFT